MEREGKIRSIIKTVLAISIGMSGGCTIKGNIDSARILNTADKASNVSGSSREFTPATCGGITDACNPNPCGPGLTCKRLGNDVSGCPISTCVENYENPSKNLSCSIYNPNTGEEIQPATPTITPYEP